ncbi:MAG: ASKHA domain-containing protein [Oscillospiraceae bacterium]|jgi:uncharacterized 2Fe-2S/4Fe-4S cluster protein (DUF4445 family)|nr:ASKHA domain-containing protein [Oscillospiraceae bacterium]
MINITFLPADKTVSVPEGTPLLVAAKAVGIHVETPCGGKGVCGKCLVRVTVGAVDFDGGWLIGEKLTAQGFVLLCTAKVKNEDVIVLTFADINREAGKFADSLGDYSRLEPSLIPSGAAEFLVKQTRIMVPTPKSGDGLSDLDRLQGAVKAALGGQLFVPLYVLRALPETLRQQNGKIYLVTYKQDGGFTAVTILAEKKPLLGVAVDLGTTTVAVSICGEEGVPLAVKTAYNGQIAHGLDIISRINYASSPARLEELREKALGTINGLIRQLAQEQAMNPEEITSLAVSGNTTMIHLLLGVFPEYIRLEPYTPAVYHVPRYTAAEIGLCAAPNAPVDMAPGVGSYLGGDITSGALCTSLAQDSEELCLFIDIGTNGEILLGNADFILGCACSAGPAFEGGGISSGMRASAGAIERVNINKETGEISFSVIGGGEPAGICGSGMISLMAELFRAGLLDAGGKFVRENFARKNPRRIVENGRNAVFVLAESGGKTVTVTEGDINNIIRAKAAIFSACRVMLKNVEMDFSDLARVYVAGGFGRYLNMDDATQIGLLPRVPRERLVFLGNSSLMGTHMALISEKHRKKRDGLARAVTYLDLSDEVGYMDEYMAAMFLPHTDSRLF